MGELPELIAGAGVTLRRVPAGAGEAVLRGDFGSVAGGSALTAAPGWPHEDTVHALTLAGGVTWLVEQDGRVVGEAGTKAAPDPAGAVEIGYGLAGASRGRGLGTRAVAALVDALLAQPDVAAVVAEVETGNEPSHRLLRRLGFVPVDAAGGHVRYRKAALG